MRKLKHWERIAGMRELGILLALLALCAALSVGTSNFKDADNLRDVARNFSFVAIMAIGQTLVILTGGIDLSVGSILGVSSCTSAYVMAHGGSLWLGILVGLAVGLAAGLINGSLISFVRLPPFIATLGMLSVARGAAYLVTKGWPIYDLPKSLFPLGQGNLLLGIPIPVIAMLVLAAGGHMLLTKTAVGRHIYAVGGNQKAARLSGINVKNTKLLVYTLSGFLSAVAGILMMAKLEVAQAPAGQGYELDVIAASVIGGTSLSGGEGTVLGALLGAAIMGVLRNGLVLWNVSAFWQQVVIGSVIILAVVLDVLRRPREEE